jgi:hypothetical protein
MSGTLSFDNFKETIGGHAADPESSVGVAKDRSMATLEGRRVGGP